MTSLRDQRIAKIACGSSHSIAYAYGVPTSTAEFSPVSFLNPHDPLGSSLLSAKETEEPGDQNEKKRPSLTHIIVSLKTLSKCQEALGHVLTALQIAYARDTIVNALQGVVMTSVQEKDSETEAKSPIELTSGVPISSLVSDDGVAGHAPHTVASDLEEFTSQLTVEDARVMVDLLKLAVSKRVGEKGKETLSEILTAMGKANPEVPLSYIVICRTLY